MTRPCKLVLALLAPFAAASARAASAGDAAQLSVSIAPAPGNLAAPQMGDHLAFSTVIRNNGSVLADGVIAWISLVQTDRGQEQPVDLEDWSAHKAVTVAALAPGQALRTDWPVRLIQAGHYRVVVSAAGRTGTTLAASPFADFAVQARPVVESGRVLPVALGVPLLLGGLLTLRLGQ